MDRRWEANEARRSAVAQARWRELAEEHRSWRERFDHEQVVRGRQARKRLGLFDVLTRKVQALDARVTTIEDTRDRSP